MTLQFLIHAADAMSELGNGTVIFDAKADILWLRSDLQQALKENFDATLPELHTRVVWKQAGDTAIAETKGLIKIGLDEFRTGKLQPDQRVIGTTVLTETIRAIWEHATIPESLEVSSFGDTFKVVFERIKNKATLVRILRVQST